MAVLNNNLPDGITHDSATVHTFTIDLTQAEIDPFDEVQVILATPDGRAHKVRISSGYFVGSQFRK